MGYIFIIHSQADNDYVAELKRALRDKNFECWSDDDIGQDEVGTHLEASAAIILIMSTDAEKSSRTQGELTYILRKKKRLFPFLLEGETWWQITQKVVYVQDGKLPDDKFYLQLARSLHNDPQHQVPTLSQQITLNFQEKVENSNIIVGDTNKVKSAHETVPAETHSPKPKPEDTTATHLPPVATQNPINSHPAAASSSPKGPVDVPKVSTPAQNFPAAASQKSSSPHKSHRNLVIIATLVGLVAAVLLCATLIVITPRLISVIFRATPTARTTLTAAPTTTQNGQPTTKVKPTDTLVAQPTDNSLLPIVNDKGAKMILIPAGSFIMGSNNDQPNEKPAHSVDLPAFYMDAYEVTNKLYKACVKDGKCQQPTSLKSHNHTDYYTNTKYDNDPVIFVNWGMAKAYCDWRSPLTRLPSEAEWEKAARGTDARTYPWGKGIDTDHANYNASDGDTKDVDSYESGKSFYGIYNMAGNVSEWVSDWFDAYPGGSASNDFGQTYRALRGGSWTDDYHNVRSSYRNRYAPTRSSDVIGFRCARSIP